MQLVVHGKRRVLSPPTAEIDCGNSATTMRLMAGSAGRADIREPSGGDASLSKRPMDRASLHCNGWEQTLRGRPGREPRPLGIQTGLVAGNSLSNAGSRAQIKSAILLGWSFCKRKNRRHRGDPNSRSHDPERMLALFLRAHHPR